MDDFVSAFLSYLKFSQKMVATNLNVGFEIRVMKLFGIILLR